MKTIHEYKPQINERLEARYLSASERVERLAPSLPVLHGFAGLAKAFRGEFARQDPNDEPANGLNK